MNRQQRQERVIAGDELALRIQKLRRRRQAGQQEQPLLRVDNRAEAAQAPFQFDTVLGRLHRRGCPAIPASSATALYGIWEVGPEELKLACPQCRPGPSQAEVEPEPQGNDLLYGLLSVVDQFSGLLRERGRDYRRNGRGQHLQLNLESLLKTFGVQEQATLGIVIDAIDGVLRKVRDLDREFDDDGDGSSA